MRLSAIVAKPKPRKIGIDGDSISAGGAAGVAIDQLGTDITSLLWAQCPHINTAVGGTTSFSGPHFDYTQDVWRDSIIYIAFGVNDINANIHTAAEIHTQIAVNVTAARNKGARAVAVGVPIWFSDELASGPKHTLGEALRTLIRADKCGATGIVDFPGIDPFFTDPTNYGPEGDGTGDGGLHPGNQGILLMANYIVRVMNPWL